MTTSSTNPTPANTVTSPLAADVTHDETEPSPPPPPPLPDREAASTTSAADPAHIASEEVASPSNSSAPPHEGPHPTIAKRIIFDGNAFDIPRGTPESIVSDNNALRRAYAAAMARPELTVIDGCSVPTLTLRVRPQVKGASTGDAPFLAALLRRVPGVRGHRRGHAALVRYLLHGGRITVGQAVRYGLGDACDGAASPPSPATSGGIRLCTALDSIPADAGGALADAM
jgi:hypothetical protein